MPLVFCQCSCSRNIFCRMLCLHYHHLRCFPVIIFFTQNLVEKCVHDINIWAMSFIVSKVNKQMISQKWQMHVYIYMLLVHSHIKCWNRQARSAFKFWEIYNLSPPRHACSEKVMSTRPVTKAKQYLLVDCGKLKKRSCLPKKKSKERHPYYRDRGPTDKSFGQTTSKPAYAPVDLA